MRAACIPRDVTGVSTDCGKLSSERTPALSDPPPPSLPGVSRRSACSKNRELQARPPPPPTLSDPRSCIHSILHVFSGTHHGTLSTRPGNDPIRRALLKVRPPPTQMISSPVAPPFRTIFGSATPRSRHAHCPTHHLPFCCAVWQARECAPEQP